MKEWVSITHVNIKIFIRRKGADGREKQLYNVRQYLTRWGNANAFILKN